jgi:hypothetical protein
MNLSKIMSRRGGFHLLPRERHVDSGSLDMKDYHHEASFDSSNVIAALDA